MQIEEETRQVFSCGLSKSESWINPNEQPVLRRVINSAIYIEEEIRNMPQYRYSTSLIGESKAAEYPKVLKTKRCCCCSNPNKCSFHSSEKSENSNNESSNSDRTLTFSPPSNLEKYYIKDNKSVLAASPSKSEETFRNENMYTESEKGFHSNSNTNLTKASENDLQLRTNRSQSAFQLSLTSLLSSTSNNPEKNVKIKMWLAKKEEERKRKKIQALKQKEEREKQKQALIEKERESFKKWLAEKKKEEEMKKRQEEMKTEEERKLKELEDEKRKLKNAISYCVWLQRKRKQELEKKIHEHMHFLRNEEERQKRMEMNEKAFNEWLKNSKNKPKPIPFNQGLQSLCSSLSVAYVNPIPWNPNITIDEKLESQCN